MQIDLKVIQNKEEYIVIRKHGAYEQHAHIPKKSMVKLLLSLIENNRLPKSRYLKGSCRRLLTEEEYKILKPKKQRYYNSNKGVRR